MKRRDLIVGAFITRLLTACGSKGALPSAPTVVEPPPSPEEITFQWIAPNENEDGSALTDLAGFRIYLNDSIINLPKSSQFEYSFVPVPGITYQIAITAYNEAGAESAKSRTLSWPNVE